VAGPTIPSAVRPLSDCHLLTAVSVPLPNIPSASISKNSCNSLTSLPREPILITYLINFMLYNYLLHSENSGVY